MEIHEGSEARLAWAGVAFVVVFVLVIVLSPDVGNPGDSAALLTKDLAGHADSAAVGTWIGGAQGVLLVLFAGALRSALRRAGAAREAALCLTGAGVLFAVVTVQHACVAAMSYLVQHGGADGVALTTLNALSYQVETAARFPMALFVGAGAVGVLRSGALPAWVGWLGVAEGVLCLVAAGTTEDTGTFAVNGPIAVPSLLLLLVWVLAASLTLRRRSRAVVAAPLQASPA